MINFKNYQEILEYVNKFDPQLYGQTRNFIDGNVSYLSPYISRGIISTKTVLHILFSNGYTISSAEKYIQELAWRDYWQQIWINKGNAIDSDLKNKQPNYKFEGVSKAIVNSNTQIEAIDIAINSLYETGYMHNHLRMYVASLACNIAKSHWLHPAKWMYYHLFDGDWASNALSWQWVAGANSSKLYYANQENINKFTHSSQTNTYLDCSYEKLLELEIPDNLNEFESFELQTNLSRFDSKISLNPQLPLILYNHYNIDLQWMKEVEANRVFILEPSFYEKYPVSEKVIDFIEYWAKQIHNIQFFRGSFEELEQQFRGTIHFKEHPTNSHYKGVEHPRDWMFEVKGYFPSFFSFWKRCLKSLK